MGLCCIGQMRAHQILTTSSALLHDILLIWGKMITVVEFFDPELGLFSFATIILMHLIEIRNLSSSNKDKLVLLTSYLKTLQQSNLFLSIL